MARLFTAVELGPDAREAVVRGQRAIAAAMHSAGDESLRLVPPPQLHVTLVFVGEVAEDRVAAFTGAMGADLAAAPFEVVFGGVGVFPARGAPRVLWCAVSAGRERLRELHAEVASRLAPLGVVADDRPFEPHLTIARWRSGGRRRPSGALPPWPVPVRQRVEQVTLVRSRLLPTGPEYTTVACARLSGGSTRFRSAAAR